MSEPNLELEFLKGLSKKKGSTDTERKWALVGEIEELFVPFLKDAKIENWNGHFLKGAYYYSEGWFQSVEERLKRMTGAAMLRLGLGSGVEELHAALKGGVRLEKPIEIPLSYQDLDCTFCGSRLKLAFNGEGFEIIAEPCPHPEGLITEFELNVPSGKIVVDDDLRQWFPVEEDYDVNVLMGTHLSSLAAAKNGFAYGFVGNTCPAVYKTGDQLVIGSYSDEIYDDEKDEEFPNPEPCPWGKQVASICTDLWWYSIADFDEFERRRQHYTPDKSQKEILEFWTFNVVDVKPGVYKFRQEQGVNRDKDSVLYATFEWVRDPDPVVDYLGAEKAKNYNATEILIQEWMNHVAMWDDARGNTTKTDFIAKWEGMTEKERLSSLTYGARQAMFTSRADDWHEKGFVRMPIWDEAKQLAAEYGDVPFFNFKHGWGNPSEDFDAICLGAGLGKSRFGPFPDLASSFVMLGLNICQNAIQFGEEPRLNTDVWPPAYEVPFVREYMSTFVKCYQAYRKKYPDLVFDAEFDAWMNEADLEKHVAEFDFGPKHPPKEKWGDPPATIKTGDYFEFDATDLHNGDIALHPLADTQSAMGHQHVDHNGRGAGVPLKVVGRVLRGTGDGHFCKHLVVTFDYGTENMTTKEWAIDERNIEGLRQFNDADEYTGLLESHKSAFDKAAAEKAEKAAKKSAKKNSKKRAKKKVKRTKKKVVKKKS